MTKYSPREHTVIRSHAILQRIRDELHRGNDLIVYYHHQERSYTLATMHGAVFNDHYVFKEWPGVTQGEMGVLRRMFNPDRRFYDQDTRQLRAAHEEKTSDQLAVGCKDREMWRRLKARLKRKGGLRHERPLFNPPVLPGEA